MKNFNPVNLFHISTRPVLNQYITSTHSRFDSVSLVCRQSDFAKFASTLTLFLCLFVGNVWGTTYYVIPATCNVPLKAGMSGASTQLFKTDGSTMSATTEISTSLTGTASFYYNSTSHTYSNLTNTSNYSSSSSSNRTMQAIKVAASANCTITVNTKRFSKLDVIYRCASSDAGKTLTIDGQDCTPGDANVHLKSITKDYSSNIIISNGSNKEFDIFVILTESTVASTWQVKGLDDGTWAGFNMTGTGTVTCSRSLSANTEYDFKLYNTSTSKWWGDGTTYKYTHAQTIVQADAGSNCKLRTSKAGTYTFSFNSSTNALTITYPDDYKGYWIQDGANWSNVYAYCYNDGTWKNADWPGVEITSQTEDICGAHYYINTSGYTTVIFNNGNSGVGNQTGDITIAGGDGKHAVGAAATEFEAFPTYTVTYNKNGDGAGGAGSVTGSVPTDSNSPYDCESTVTVLGNTGSLERTGYNFIGWNTQAEGNGTPYIAGNTFTITANTTLYAQWELIPTYDVIYNANGGTGTTASQTGNLTGAQVTTSANSFTRSGYKFKWWNTATDGSGEDFYPGEKVTIASANVTLYAQWEEVAADWAFWVGDVAASSATTDVTGNGTTMRLTRSSTSSGKVDWNTNLTEDATIVNKYNSSVNKHAKVIAVADDDYYLQVHFTNGSPINSLKLGVCNKGGNKEMVVIYSTTSDFSSGEGEKVAHNTSKYDQANKNVVDFSPSIANKYFYARIYRKAGTAVYGYTGGSGNTIRIYSIKAEKGCIAPTALTAASTTAKGTTFTVTDGADTNDYEFYVSTSNSAPTAESTATYTVSGGKSLTISNLVAGTEYYAWVRSKCDASHKSLWTALTGNTFTTSTVSASYNLTNVTKSSGATSGIGGSDFTATFTGETGYALPSTITVTIDGNNATSGTDYTWTAGTGTLTIPANKINGDIVVTINSATEAPSQVDISGGYHYYPGETIELTATPTGGNGPVTYQWYHGGTADGNAIDGATSATFSKTCEVGDAGSYYCKVTYGGTESTWSDGAGHNSFDVKVMQFVLKNNSGVTLSTTPLSKVDATHASIILNLTGGTTYKFRITDGCGNYFGYSTTITSVNCTDIYMSQDADCSMTTSVKTTNYTFNVDLTGGLGTGMKVSVVYPGGDQAADKVIYWDNSVLNWAAGSQWYRIGRSNHHNKTQMTLVPGTANLYKVTTATYNNFEYWHIANNQGNGDGNLFWTKGDADKAITHAMAFEGAPVTLAAITVTPTTSHATGETDDTNNCEFYTYNTTPNMKTQTVSITAPTNGTITVSYTDTDNDAQSFNSGSQTLAHTVIITPTAVANTGYELSGLTVNGAVRTSGNTYTVTSTTTVAATFAAKTYNITLDRNGALSGSESVTMTYNSASHTAITAPEKAGYTFDGWYDSETDDNGSGNLVMDASGVLQANVTGFTGAGGIWTKDATCTLYAKWTAEACFTMAANSSAGSDATLSHNESISAGSKNCSTLSGGTAKYVDVDGSASMTVSKLSSSKYGWIFNHDKDQLVITMTGTKLQVGSIITLSGYANSSGKGLQLNGVTVAQKDGSAGAFTDVVYTVKSTDTELIDKSVLTMTRISGSGVYLYSISIANCATKISYDITYELYGGSLDGSQKTSYSPEDDDYDLPTPTWAGHVFLGWYETYSAGVYSNPVSILPSGSIGNKTYHAKWADAAAVVWTITKVDSKLYKGSSGYSVKAVVNDASWSGNEDDLVMSASDGVILGTPTKSVVSSKKQIEASFDVGCDVEDEAITFTLTGPAVGTYAAIEDSHDETLDECLGGRTVIFTSSNKNDAGNEFANMSTSSNTTQMVGRGLAKLIAIGSAGLSSTTKKEGYRSDSRMEMVFYFASTSTLDVYVIAPSTSRSYALYSFSSDKALSAIETSDYSSCTIVKSNVSVEGAAFPHTTAGTPSVSNGTITISGTAGGAKISYTGLSGFYVFKALGSSESYIYGFDVNGGSSNVGIETSLTWSGSLTDKATVNKNDVDDDFTYEASKNNNSVGEITYSSSNTSVATVNSSGKVHIVGDGTTTITATVGACGCFKSSSISYTLVVASTCPDEPGTIVNDDGSTIEDDAISRGACETTTLKLIDYTEGATIQWYKDDATISGATSATYTIPAGESGVYSARIRKDCPRAKTSTNSIIVTTAGEIDPTIFADEFSVKDDRWFGYRLMQINKGETVSVTTPPSGWIENEDFKITTDAKNIVSIEGKLAVADNADKTLTLTIKNSCGGSVDKNISIHELVATSQPTVAWIATDKDNKGDVTKVKADESTNTALYKYLKDYYTLTPRNCYYTTDEKLLVKEYSKYDLIILTDYPDSQVGPESNKDRSRSYTNALGLLIDHKPILTFEAFVSGCPNWGISSNPQDTKATQNTLTLLCNADDIFGTSDKFYAGADIAAATVGSGQSLQGFAVNESPDFVFIAKITDGGKDYITCCERQVVTTARMMVFGLNGNTMSKITNDGKEMVKGFVDYLLIMDPADVPDCSVIFKGGTSGHETDWYTPTNWEGNSLPHQYASVRIDAPCEVGANANPARAGYVKIHTGSDGGHTYNGHLTINPQGALIVQKSITRVEGNHYTIRKATNIGDLTIESNETNGNGTLIFDNKEGKSQAIVEMYSRAQNGTGTWSWQYIAVPFNDNSSAYRNFYGSWLYRWAADNSGWEDVPNRAVVYPWIGYCLTQETAKLYYMDGTLVETTEQKFTVQTGKDMVVGNSWTAPIQVKQLTDKDFGGLTKTIYLFNTGMDSTKTGSMSGGRYEAGTYVVVPIHSSPYTGDSLISSLQAFTVTNASGSDATLTLNYDRHVRPARATDKVNAGPMHARQRDTDDNEPTVLKIWASGSHYDDRLVLIERSDFSTGYDSGWDGEKIMIGGAGPEIYSLMENGNMESVSAIDDLEGTIVGFRAGEDNEYTFRFEYSDDAEDIYLLDTDERIYIHILTGNTYTFTTNDKVAHNRFIITHKAPYIPTGCDNTGAEGPKAKKFIADDKVYILLNGVLYDLMGKVVK